MTVNALQPDRAIAYGSVQLGGCRQAAKAPFFLVPAATDDPPATRILGGIGSDLGLRFGQRSSFRQIQRQRAKANAHNVGMGVNHAGDDILSLAVEQEIDAAGSFVAAFENQLDPAVVINPQAGEALDFTVRANGHALDMVHQRIGGGRGRNAQHKHRSKAGKSETCSHKSVHYSVPSGKRRISELVSCRLPPISCISA